MIFLAVRVMLLLVFTDKSSTFFGIELIKEYINRTVRNIISFCSFWHDCNHFLKQSEPANLLKPEKHSPKKVSDNVFLVG